MFSIIAKYVCIHKKENKLRLFKEKTCLEGLQPHEPRREKNGFLHMRKQRRRSASR